MTHALTLARQLVAELEASADGEAPGQPADAFTTGTRAGVQVDAEALAELVDLAAHVRLTPSLTLRLALRALSVELAKGTTKAPGRLVGKR